MRSHLQIAIDGPAGVGKSTIGERLARQLDYVYIDTGAFYRTLTYMAVMSGIPPDEADGLEALARRMHIEITMPTAADGRQYTVLVDGTDVTPYLRTPSVETAVSRVSSHDPVRATLIEQMRKMADLRGVVMVGRDIGTVVLPEADVKIFLTTSIPVRAKRRHCDLVAKYGSNSPSLETVEREITQRDAIDAPHTRVASDATIINNDHLEADDVVRIILQIISKRRNQEHDR
ncbi:MAG: (d)CMP kinase [Chloroflexi bacterium]|nr:MAG: (d)CMP kinase [Chloroflexota bacterium]